MNNMKETLFNQIKQSEFDLIVSLGKGELKSQDTFYYLKQMTLNQVKLYNFTHTYNGIKRNGYHFYTQLEVGDNIIIYNKEKINQ